MRFQPHHSQQAPSVVRVAISVSADYSERTLRRKRVAQLYGTVGHIRTTLFFPHTIPSGLRLHFRRLRPLSQQAISCSSFGADPGRRAPSLLKFHKPVFALHSEVGRKARLPALVHTAAGGAFGPWSQRIFPCPRARSLRGGLSARAFLAPSKFFRSGRGSALRSTSGQGRRLRSAFPAVHETPCNGLWPNNGERL